MKVRKLLDTCVAFPKSMPTAKVKFIDNDDYYTVILKNIPFLKNELLEKKVRDVYAYSDTIYIYLQD